MQDSVLALLQRDLLSEVHIGIAFLFLGIYVNQLKCNLLQWQILWKRMEGIWTVVLECCSHSEGISSVCLEKKKKHSYFWIEVVSEHSTCLFSYCFLLKTILKSCTTETSLTEACWKSNHGQNSERNSPKPLLFWQFPFCIFFLFTNPTCLSWTYFSCLC